MLLPIEKTIATLSDGRKPLLNSKLTDLSNLTPAELELFRKTWARVEVERRRQIIYRLVELAEGNLELNFDSIFITCLKDEDAEVKSKAIEGLWENEEASLINPLTSLLTGDSSEKVQAAAASALGKFAMLAEFQKLRPSYTARIYRALLGVIGDKTRSVEIRRRALEAAAPLNLPSIKETIMEAYQSKEPKLRVSAIYAMGKNCDSSWLPTLLKELGSTDAEMRYEAAGACGELEEKEAAPYLAGLTTDPDADVQKAAIQALGKIGGSEARDCLKQCLLHPDETVQQAAEQALNEFKGEEDLLSL